MKIIKKLFLGTLTLFSFSSTQSAAAADDQIPSKTEKIDAAFELDKQISQDFPLMLDALVNPKTMSNAAFLSLIDGYRATDNYNGLKKLLDDSTINMIIKSGKTSRISLLDYARQWNDENFVRILLEKGCNPALGRCAAHPHAAELFVYQSPLSQALLSNKSAAIVSLLLTHEGYKSFPSALIKNDDIKMYAFARWINVALLAPKENFVLFAPYLGKFYPTKQVLTSSIIASISSKTRTTYYAENIKFLLFGGYLDLKKLEEFLATADPAVHGTLQALCAEYMSKREILSSALYNDDIAGLALEFLQDE